MTKSLRLLNYESYDPVGVEAERKWLSEFYRCSKEVTEEEGFQLLAKKEVWQFIQTGRVPPRE
jgi:hypothetical protein